MSHSSTKGRMANRSILRRLRATTLAVSLFGALLTTSGIAQTPGYGVEPDRWAPYESGRYFDHLQKVLRTYQLSGWKIDYLHFQVTEFPVGPVDLFRISHGRECRDQDDCYFVLFSSDMPEAPLVTACQFEWGGYAHFFNPDRSNLWGFQFACKDTALQVKVTPTHFSAMSIPKNLWDKK